MHPRGKADERERWRAFRGYNFHASSAVFDGVQNIRLVP